VRLDDPERLAALRATGLLDSWPEPEFDRVTRLAARALAAPVAILSLVDADRAFLKSHVGVPEPAASDGNLPVSQSVSRLIVEEERPVVVRDPEDGRVAGTPIITDTRARAFCGVPLRVGGGPVLGALCVIDGVPREWTEGDVTALEDLAGIAMAEVELRATIARERVVADQRDEVSRALESLHGVGRALVSELELERVVQQVTDTATGLVQAAFGAFFYNVVDEAGEAFMLHTLSGAPRSAFDGFPLPRTTDVFRPTFAGIGTVRFDDVTAQPHYGRNPPYHGMPPGHLPVRSYLAVPVVSDDGEVLGGLFFGHPEPGRFGTDAAAVVEGIAGYAAVAIANARHYEQAHAVSLTLQRALLPDVASIPGVEVAVRYLPAAEAEVGGDWYDVTPLPDGSLGITVGDVAGHNIRAAAHMGSVRTAVRVYALEGLPPGVVLQRTDAYLAASGPRELVTVVQATCRPAERRLAIARAGHPPPLLVPSDGPARFLEHPAQPPLGFGLLVAAPTDLTVELEPHDAVVFFTDGLVERRNSSIDDDLERLRVLATGEAHRRPEDLCDLLIERLTGGSGAPDDVALVVLQLDS
jgi:GAF domain-containing protein